MALANSASSIYLGEKQILQKSQLLQKTTKYFPLLVESKMNDGQVSGSVYALLNYPAHRIKEKLLQRETWCFIVHMHPNIKACLRDQSGNRIRVYFGSKKSNRTIQSQGFVFQSGPQQNHYYGMALTANKGPYQTRQYYIVLEAVTYQKKSTILRLAYGYEYGRQARLMQHLYFSTIARKKEGFSLYKDKKGRTVPVRGLQAAVERNSMRYFLAVRAFFETDAKNQSAYDYWFDLTSHYPQLYELSKEQYLSNKDRERRHQSTLEKRFSGEP